MLWVGRVGLGVEVVWGCAVGAFQQCLVPMFGPRVTTIL